MMFQSPIVLLVILCFCEVYCAIPFFLKEDLCLSSQCEEILNIQNSLNHTVLPCDDFYKYSCSSFLHTNKQPFEAVWNNFLATSYKINKKIENILETSNEKELWKPKMFYRACLDLQQHEDRYKNDLNVIIDYFKGWPIANDSWNFIEYDWLEEIVQITKIVGMHPILKFHVNVDYKENTKYALYIEPGSLIFPQHILLNPKQFRSELIAYKTWISDTINYLYPGNTVVDFEVKKIIEFEMKLARLMSGKGRIEKIQIWKLSRRFGKYFLKGFNLLFDQKHRKLKPSDTVNIQNYGYFRNLMGFLKTVEQKDVANYLIWSIVKELSRETSGHLQHLNFLVNKAVLSISADLPRHTECTNKVTNYLGLAILPQFLDTYFSKSILNDVKSMVDNIKDAFINLLEDTEWLSAATKKLAIGKIQNIQVAIGYPDWAQSAENVEKYYDKLNVSDDHLLNILMAKTFKIEQNLSLLNKTVNSIAWPTTPFDVNTYYTVLQNAIFIPLGILQQPFYYENGPSFMNYGALGSLIGHEISHSLDTTGRQANKEGIITKWWPQNDIFSYESKIGCFEKKFGSKSLLAVGENIADTVGLKISFDAFSKLEQNKLSFDDKRQQLFFIKFAQIWCEISTNQHDLFNDEHTLAANRVNKTVLNSEDFIEIFQCNRSDDDSNCNLWF